MHVLVLSQVFVYISSWHPTQKRTTQPKQLHHAPTMKAPPDKLITVNHELFYLVLLANMVIWAFSWVIYILGCCTELSVNWDEHRVKN